MDAKNYENIFGNRYLSGIIGIDVEGIVPQPNQSNRRW